MVQEALERIRATRKLTTVTVAHRLSTIVHSDQIAVIADGSIQELGTHRQLIKEGGIYALLCEGQGLTADAADVAESSDSAVPTTTPKEGAIETPMTTKPNGNADDIEAAIIADAEEDGTDGSPDISGVLSRLWEYNKADRGYMTIGYIGGIIVGALPACEAILFGYITGNYFIIDDPQELRSTNFSLSLWFILFAGVSFVANIAMGVGFVSLSEATLLYDDVADVPVILLDLYYFGSFATSFYPSCILQLTSPLYFS